MQEIFTILQVVSGLVLSFLILIQTSKTGLSRTVASNINFARRGLEKIVFRATFVFASVFIISSIIVLLI